MTGNKKNIKLIRITTVPVSLKYLLTGQMKYMSQRGFDVVMISAGGPEVEDLIKYEGGRFIAVPMTRTISPFQDLRCLWQLIKIFREEKPDIVHTHTPKAGLLGMLAARISGVPVRMHTIAGLPLMTASGFKRQLLIIIEKLTYWAADTVLPNSKSIQSFIIDNKFTKSSKLKMIGYGSSNGIDLNHFSKEFVNEKNLSAIKKKIGYAADYKYILSVGRVVKDKGIEELVKTFLRINSDNDRVKLIIVGKFESNRKEETLSGIVLNLVKSHNNIIHIDWSDSIREYMYLANLLVHASHREGFPNVVLQAGAMELPIICSDIPGNIDIVDDLKTGLHYKAKNPDDLYLKLRYALNNLPLMDDYAKRLRGIVVEKYSREYVQEKLYEFYISKLKKD